MGGIIKKDTWVEIHQVILDKGQRASQVPADTQQVPLEMKVKGFLVSDAKIGETATVATPIGRIFSGTLVAENPEYTHQFGHPIAELMSIGRQVRRILEDWRMA